MDPKNLEWVLDTLAGAGCFDDPDDRAACERTADALRHRLVKITGPVRVLLVHGPDADPLVYDLETISQYVDEWGDNLRTIGGMVDELRTELTERRKRVTAERDAFRHAALTLADSLDEVASGELGLDDIKAERLAVRALLSDPAAVIPQTDAGPGCGGRDLP